VTTTDKALALGSNVSSRYSIVKGSFICEQGSWSEEGKKKELIETFP